MIPETGDPNCFALRVEGDSMLPGLKAGHIVIVSPSSLPENGEICAVKLKSEEVAVKLWHDQGNGLVVLKSMNDAYEPRAAAKFEIEWAYPVVQIMLKRMRR